MRRLGELIDQNVPMLAELETRDTGLPISQTRKQLIPRASRTSIFRRSLHPHERPHHPVDEPDAELHAVPAGGRVRVGLPWNVPFMTATWKTAPRAGQHGVLKMSELSPLDRRPARHAGVEAGIPPGVLNGAGLWRRCGRCAGASPGRARHLVHGGTVTGKKILAPAASRNTRWSWAASRRCWCSTTPTSSAALDAALFTIFSLNGERCTAGSRIFVQETIYDDFVCRFAERANRLVVGDPTDEHTHVGSMITRQHWEKVTGYIRLAEEEGARVLAGGGTARRLAGAAGWRQLASHGAGRRGQPHALRPGRDLRPGRLPAALQGRGRRPDAGQRCEVRTGVPTSGPAISAARIGWRAASRPAWCSSTARTCATCASLSAAPRNRARVGRRRIQLRGIRRGQERLRFHGQPSHPRWGV